MTTFSRLHKIFLVSLGAVSGSVAYYHVNGAEDERKLHVHNSWTTNYTPSVKWDRNWDRREPESIVKPAHKSKPEDQNRYNEQIETAKSKSVRHLFLIRHGQYNLAGATDKDRTLTDLGKVQADLTGQRLACLNIKWDVLVRSTMTRAAETAEIIAKHLDDTIEVKDCQLIEEGAPIPPEPPVGHWRPEPKPDDRRVKVLSRSGERYAQCMYSPFISFEACTQFIYAYEFMPASVLPDRYILNTFKQFFQDSARIEAAFRRYFYRAPPEQKQDSYTLLVCHANVIRFFVCKALQFSPEGWLRISLNHGSITWLSIMPNGNVILRALSDTGHMEPKFITSR